MALRLKGQETDEYVRSAYGDARITAPRASVAMAVADRCDAFTIEDLMRSLRGRGTAAVSTATVYRAVAAMERSGHLERVGTRLGSVLYMRCGAHDHHHHIICDACGRTVATECPLGPRIARVAEGHGFTITRHDVTLYGLCGSCSRKGRTA